MTTVSKIDGDSLTITMPVIEATASIANAFLTRNPMECDQVPAFAASIHAALMQEINGKPEEPKLEPAISIRKSITPDHIICLEDGKKFKSLKRHLRTHYDLTPDDYRQKWGLPKDYPMVAPNYSAARSQLAKEMGLGEKGRHKAPATNTEANGVDFMTGASAADVVNGQAQA